MNIVVGTTTIGFGVHYIAEIHTLVHKQFCRQTCLYVKHTYTNCQMYTDKLVIRTIKQCCQFYIDVLANVSNDRNTNLFPGICNHFLVGYIGLDISVCCIFVTCLYSTKSSHICLSR